MSNNQNNGNESGNKAVEDAKNQAAMKQLAEQEKLKEASKQAEVIRARAVYGEMVDPHTGIRFNVENETEVRLNGWIQMQIDAKKIELT